MSRTALLIRCSEDEAKRIRTESAKERRTVSAYVANIMAKAVAMEILLLGKLTRYRVGNSVLSRCVLTVPGPRTALLVRCSANEADAIREAAKRREMPINAFVLQSIQRVWTVQDRIAIQRNLDPRER